jgi:hypothetical protein
MSFLACWARVFGWHVATRVFVELYPENLLYKEFNYFGIFIG